MKNSKTIIKIAILNDILETELLNIIGRQINDRELKEALVASKESCQNLTKVFDRIIGDNANSFTEIYDKADDAVENIVGNLMKL